MKAIAKLAFVFGIAVCLRSSAAEPTFPPIPRIIPPAGIDVPADDLARLKSGVEALAARVAKANESLSDELKSLLPDVEIYLKAVRYAVENGEFYDPKDIGRADEQLKQGNARLDELLAGKHSWTEARGLVVRGYRSGLDDSVQPYGLVIPKDLDLSKSVPLYIWLHGRGDKVCDLQFIAQRQTNVGQISPPNAIVLHPFGRYCNAFKFGGEMDIFDAGREVAESYRIDQNRLVLWGFSMGGAGAWHLGAHHAELWVAVSPGAGFAETARYQNLDPSKTPEYERTLWGWYDAPNYVRNLFNVPVIAYSGELDKQIQAARIMEEAYKAEGRTLEHLIGPGVEHKYNPETLGELSRRIDALVAGGKDRYPTSVTAQTRTLRYSQFGWLTIDGLHEHWRDSRVDAEAGERTVTLTTKNVTRLSLTSPWAGIRRIPAGTTIKIDGAQLTTPSNMAIGRLSLEQIDGQWQIQDRPTDARRGPLRKSRLSQGPIDDAFMSRFIVVLPTGRASTPAVHQWVEAELAHFKDRWRRLFRGELIVKKDTEVELDAPGGHLILWGDRASNRLIDQLADTLPIRWSASDISLSDRSFNASGHVLSMIYPNPRDHTRYVVINSGITFREGHDRSNSLQTPKLPDWAVIDLSKPPDQFAPGKIAAAGFFDEKWQLKPEKR